MAKFSQGMGPMALFFFFSSKKARWERTPIPRTAKTKAAARSRLPAKRFPITAKPKVAVNKRESMVLVLMLSFF